MTPVSRGFTGKPRPTADASRIPPGQYLTSEFPVLSAGPTPRIPLEQWSFAIKGAVKTPVSWSWSEFQSLPQETFTVDIHCVTKWSKLGTIWTGVSLDTLLGRAGPTGGYAMAWSEGGYTTNVPLADLTQGKAWIVTGYDNQPLHPEHGGPARLLVPHLYFWKSAKWVRGLEVLERDEPGFWEQNGYHIYGDPWREQRYWGD